MYYYNCAQSLFTSFHFYLLIRALMKCMQQHRRSIEHNCNSGNGKQRSTVFDDRPHDQNTYNFFYGQSRNHFQCVVVLIVYISYSSVFSFSAHIAILVRFNATLSYATSVRPIFIIISFFVSVYCCMCGRNDEL